MAKLIWIEGLIGAGKTTLTRALAEALTLRPLFEPVEANFLLADFYRDPDRYAFAMQMHLLMVRFNLQQLAAAEVLSPTPYRGVVLDRGLPGDRVFARVQLRQGHFDETMWRVYEHAFNSLMCALRPPSLLLFLDADPTVAHARLQARGRDFERDISLEYLRILQAEYHALLDELTHGRHAWGGGVQVLTLPWGQGDDDIDAAVEAVRARLSEA